MQSPPHSAKRPHALPLAARSPTTTTTLTAAGRDNPTASSAPGRRGRYRLSSESRCLNGACKWEAEYILIQLCGAVEGADQIVLSAIFADVARTFRVNPRSLGALTMVRGLLQALSSPLGGWLDSKYERRTLIAIGCLLWGIATAGMALSMSFTMLFSIRALNGIGLGIVPPLILAYVADMFQSKDHGKAFGVLGLTAGMGAALCGAVATVIAGHNSGGIDGWRLALLMIAVLSVLTGVATFVVVRRKARAMGIEASQEQGAVTDSVRAGEGGKFEVGDRELDLALEDDFEEVDIDNLGAVSPVEIEEEKGDIRKVKKEQEKAEREAREIEQQEGNAGNEDDPKGARGISPWKAMLVVGKIPTFQVIIAQGVLGSMPWSAMAFLTWWLELACFSHLEAALLVSVMAVGVALGNFIGGYIGDVAAALSPNHGRAFCAQFSVLSGIPITYLILFGLPTGERRSVATFAIVLFIFGSCISWCSPAVTNPIMSEIVPVRLRSVIFSLDRTFEGAVAAVAPAIVGALATNVFGWSDDHSVTCDEHDKDALGKAMFWTMSSTWIGCLFFYTLLHWTYPIDKVKAVHQAEGWAAVNVASSSVAASGLGIGSSEFWQTRSDTKAEFSISMGTSERNLVGLSDVELSKK